MDPDIANIATEQLYRVETMVNLLVFNVTEKTGIL
jgi:hypothetical protein